MSGPAFTGRLTSPHNISFPKVSRVEVIDHTGRAYVLWKDGIRVHAQLQDDDRTLKLFIEGGEHSSTDSSQKG